jgi:hypothetical protein
MSLGHQACFGGNAACGGMGAFNGPVGLGTDVEIVTLGALVPAMVAALPTAARCVATMTRKGSVAATDMLGGEV